MLKTEKLFLTVSRGSASAFIAQIIGLAFNMVLHILLARWMGIEHYGIYSYVLSWSLIFVLISKFGYDTMLIRFVASYEGEKKWGQLKGLLYKSHKLVLFISLILASILGFVLLFLKRLMQPELFYTLLPGLLVGIVISQLQLVSSSLIGLRRIVLAKLPMPILRPVVLIGFLMGVFVLKKHFTASSVMMLNLITCLLMLSLGFYLLKKTLPRIVHKFKPLYERKKWSGIVFPLFLISGIHLLLNQTGMLMIGTIKGAYSAGIYAAVIKLAYLMIFVLTAFNTVTAPLIARFYARGEKSELQRLLKMVSRSIAILTVPIGFALILKGGWFLLLFGNQFTEGHEALVIIVLGQFINAVCGPVGFLFTMTGNQNISVKVMGASAVLNIVLNFLLVPGLGINGAAISQAISTAFWNIVLVYLGEKKLGFRTIPL